MVLNGVNRKIHIHNITVTYIFLVALFSFFRLFNTLDEKRGL